LTKELEKDVEIVGLEFGYESLYIEVEAIRDFSKLTRGVKLSILVTAGK
jgi:hypothetical protein